MKCECTNDGKGHLIQCGYCRSKNAKSMKPKIEEEDLLELLKRELPYYASDDKDDYFYLARSDDVKRVARLLARMIEAWL